MLTIRMQEALSFVDTFTQQKGYGPSFEEIKDGLGLKSKSGVHRLMESLTERGFVRRIPGRSRAVEVIRPSMGVSTFPAKSQAIPKKQSKADVVTLALMGRIAAGVPIAAISDTTRSIAVPGSMVGSGEHFSLEVVGDSMIDAGIHNGDTVVVKRTPVAQNGDIVVAFIDGEEATLKRLRRRGSRVALEPANAAYETRVFDSDRVEIQGILSGLIRRFQ